MARYIFIDRESGFIWGDSADINGKIVTGTPCEVAAALDASLQDGPYAAYSETNKHDAERVYDVYRSDIDGSEAIGVIHDGTDQEMIDAVERECRYVTSIARSDTP